MKTKHIKLSLLILTGLVILSYGFLISAQEGFNSTANVFTPAAKQDAPTDLNLTKDVARKLSALTTSSDPADQQISLESLQKSIDASLNQKFSETDLPEISSDSIKIKKQKYKGTADQIKAKKKEDFANYMVAVYYVLSSNSPKPITSNSDVISTFNSLVFDIATSIGSRQSSALDEIQKSGEKMFTQLQDIEVPEDLIDLHLKGLKFAQYTMSIKNDVASNDADPLLDLSNLARMESFVGTLSGFFEEAQNKFTEYGINYDDLLMQKINMLGAPAPDPKDLESAAAEILKNSPSATASSGAVSDTSVNNSTSNEN